MQHATTQDLSDWAKQYFILSKHISCIAVNLNSAPANATFLKVTLWDHPEQDITQLIFIRKQASFFMGETYPKRTGKGRHRSLNLPGDRGRSVWKLAWKKTGQRELVIETQGEVTSRILEHDKEKELSIMKIYHTLRDQSNPSLIWDKNTFIQSSPGYPKKNLNCSCQIIRKCVDVYFAHWDLYCIFHLAWGISKYHSWNNISMCTKLFVSPWANTKIGSDGTCSCSPWTTLAVQTDRDFVAKGSNLLITNFNHQCRHLINTNQKGTWPNIIHDVRNEQRTIPFLSTTIFN